MDPVATKQQIVERIRQANNILVTVSANPSVDQLAACIGLTLLLNRMEKHATAVFSGIVPSTIEFLQPEKTIETNTDSLRDFIISLDKNKADKLRYKVEDQVVKIFITPYKTSLSQNDLVFSQGDFNVEVVIALGVKDRGQIDAAITANGRILHDATVISLNAGTGTPAAKQEKVPDIGQINWQDPTASSLSEMLVGISEAFGSGLIDNQMATSFLTGIVAETGRFSNSRTSPKVMTIAAQLMAAGANQQLIVSKLEPPQSAPIAKQVTQKPPERPTGPKPNPAETLNGTLSVSHEPAKKDSPEVAVNASEIHIDEQGNLSTTPGPAAVKEGEDVAPAPAPRTKAEADPFAQVPPPQASRPPAAPDPGPHTFLDPKNYQPTLDTPFTANTQPEWNNLYDSVSMNTLGGESADGDQGFFKHNNPIKPPQDASPMPAPQPATDLTQIRSAVEQAADAAPFNPADHPVQALGATPVDLTPPGSAGPSLPLPGINPPAPNLSPPPDDKPPEPPLNPPPITLPSVPPIPANTSVASQ